VSHAARQVYVISDLHLGGDYPEAGSDDSRGFRICTHADDVAAFIRSLSDRPNDAPPAELVINGDMVDFLAERHDEGEPWRAFNADPDTAVALMRRIAERDRVVFDALKDHLAAGHRLVILLGNHDVEMALPQVRAALEEILDARGKDFVFIHDGEAYVVGEALIEHGNEYDGFNRVNYAQLRVIRAELSRRRTEALDFFEAPPGSHLVADAINPVKELYRFIDLLKPQNEAAIPMLVALEPGYRSLLRDLARAAQRITSTDARRAAARKMGADVAGKDVDDEEAFLGTGAGAAVTTRAAPVDSDPLDEQLTAALGDDAEAFRQAVDASTEDDGLGQEISAGGKAKWLAGSLAMMLSRGDDEAAVTRRLPALRLAVQANRDSTAFDRDVEGAKEYRQAAERLATGPIRHVVFGHTHLPKRVALPSGGFYLNSGTWADVLRFPNEILEGSKEEQDGALRGFVDAMRRGDFSEFTLFRPTYVRLDVGADGKVTEAALCDWEGSAS